MGDETLFVWKCRVGHLAEQTQHRPNSLQFGVREWCNCSNGIWLGAKKNRRSCQYEHWISNASLLILLIRKLIINLLSDLANAGNDCGFISLKLNRERERELATLVDSRGDYVKSTGLLVFTSLSSLVCEKFLVYLELHSKVCTSMHGCAGLSFRQIKVPAYRC